MLRKLMGLFQSLPRKGKLSGWDRLQGPKEEGDVLDRSASLDLDLLHYEQGDYNLKLEVGLLGHSIEDVSRTMLELLDVVDRYVGKGPVDSRSFVGFMHERRIIQTPVPEDTEKIDPTLLLCADCEMPAKFLITELGPALDLIWGWCGDCDIG